MGTPTRNDPLRFLSVTEAADRFGVAGPTIRRWVRDGHLRAARPGGDGGRLLIPEAELKRLAQGQDR